MNCYHSCVLLAILAVISGCFGYQYVITHTPADSSFLEDLVFTPIDLSQGEDEQVPGPMFPFYFFGDLVTEIRAHPHGSIHFNPSHDHATMCCSGTCDLVCQLGTNPSGSRRTSPAIIPYSSPLMHDYTFKQSVSSSYAHYALQTDMSRAGETVLRYTVILIYPSSIIILFDELEGTDASHPQLTDIFSGLIAPKHIKLSLSSHYTGSTSTKTYPSSFTIPASQMVAYKEQAIQRGMAYMYCAIGATGCLSLGQTPAVQTQPRNVHFTVNSDAACFRATKSPILSKFVHDRSKPEMLCKIIMYTETGGPNWTIYQTYNVIAQYNEDTDVFDCVIPAEVSQSPQRYGTVELISQESTLPADFTYYQPNLVWSLSTPEISLEYIESYGHYYKAYGQHQHPAPPLVLKNGLLPHQFDLQLPTDDTVDPVCICSSFRFRMQESANPETFMPYQYGLPLPSPSGRPDTISYGMDYCYRDCSGTLNGAHTFGKCLQCSNTPVEPNCAGFCSVPPGFDDLCTSASDGYSLSNHHNPSFHRLATAASDPSASAGAGDGDRGGAPVQETGSQVNPDRLAESGFTTKRYYIAHALTPLQWFKIVILILIVGALACGVWLSVRRIKYRRKLAEATERHRRAKRGRDAQRRDHEHQQPSLPPPP